MPDHVREVVEEERHRQIDRDPPEREEREQPTEAAVREQRPEIRPRRQRSVQGHPPPLPGHPPDRKPGPEDPERENAAADRPGPRVPPEPVDQRLEADEGQQRPEQRGHRAERRERGPLVVALGHLGQQRLIGHGDDGHADADHDVGRDVVGELEARALDLRRHPDRGEADREGNRPDQQVGPTPPRLPARAIREPPHPDVRQRVGAAPEERHQTRQADPHADDFGQVEGEDHRQRHQRDVDRVVTEPVDQLDVEGQPLVLHGREPTRIGRRRAFAATMLRSP